MSVVAYVKDYLADKSASMATQVVMFSVLLFGTSGVVLDFGRVYSEHSIMQSYTDQAALAAAAELDGRSDSHIRAVNAVFGGLDENGDSLGAPLTKTAVFSSGADNQFNISHLVFLENLANDAGAQSSMAGIQSDIVYVAFADGGTNGNASDVADKARYVIAVAEERSVSNTLISLINSGAETAAASSNVVRTVAAATRRKNFCGEFSNLVMCSRQSDMAGQDPESISTVDQDLGEFMEHFEGARFVHIADNNAGTETHRLYRRSNPALTSITALQSLCNDPLVMPGASEGEANGKIQQYQAICHLAAATHRDHCIGDTIEIVRAEPEVITTALNVAFDKWDFPISRALSWEGTSLQGQLALLQPDLLIYDGQIRSDEPTITSNGFNFGLIGTETETDASRLHYEGTNGSSNINVNIPSCFNNASGYSSCGIASHIGPAANQSDDLQEYYEENYPEHFLHVNNGLNLDSAITSFFDMYLVERSEWTHTPTDINYSENVPTGPAAFNLLTGEFEIPTAEVDYTIPAGSSLAVTGEDGSLALTTPWPENTPQIDGPGETDHLHVNYPLLVNPDDSQYRRRMSIPLVNCDNMDFDPTTGTAQVKVLEFVDMYLLQPPRAFCGGGGTPTTMCNNADVASASVFTEFVEKSVYIETDYPELVR